MQIGSRRIGSGERCYVIAEAGVNHDGEVDVAHALVDVARDAGADAVKFQTFDPALLVSAAAPTADYQRRTTGTTSQQELLAALTLPTGAWAELAAHAAEVGLQFLSTAFDIESAQLLAGLDVPAFKVPSGELVNLPFLRGIAALGRPMLISTGMATHDEVAAALEAALAAPSLALFHCVSAYPAPVEEANLRAIPAMADAFSVPVGWSDHTVGTLTAVAAVALGAALLEKHITLDPARPGPDHAASASPEDFHEYVTAVRAVEGALGDGVKRPSTSEVGTRDVVRRSWHVRADVEAGHRLDAAELVLLRPAVGLPPARDPVGRTTRGPLRRGEPVRDEDLV